MKRKASSRVRKEGKERIHRRRMATDKAISTLQLPRHFGSFRGAGREQARLAGAGGIRDKIASTASPRGYE